MQTSHQIVRLKIIYVHPRKSTVILSSNDVIACYVIVDVANFDLGTKNPRSAPDATNSDAVLTQVKDAIRTNKWDSPAVKPFKPVKEELTTTSQGIVLRGTRIVIPAVLQQRTIDLAHQAHLGIDKTKSLIREKIWFPQIDNRV